MCRVEGLGWVEVGRGGEGEGTDGRGRLLQSPPLLWRNGRGLGVGGIRAGGHPSAGGAPRESGDDFIVIAVVAGRARRAVKGTISFAWGRLSVRPQRRGFEVLPLGWQGCARLALHHVDGEERNMIIDALPPTRRRRGGGGQLPYFPTSSIFWGNILK